MSASIEGMLKLARTRVENQRKSLREAGDVLEGAIKGNLKALKVAAAARVERIKRTVEATEAEIADLEKLVADTVAQQLPFGEAPANGSRKAGGR